MVLIIFYDNSKFVLIILKKKWILLLIVRVIFVWNICISIHLYINLSTLIDFICFPCLSCPKLFYHFSFFYFFQWYTSTHCELGTDAQHLCFINKILPLPKSLLLLWVNTLLPTHFSHQVKTYLNF